MNISLKDIDRTLFEILRLAVVNAGMYPDITKYKSRKDFEAAKESMRSSGIELVEPVGVGAWPSKDERTSSKLVLIRRRINKGGLTGSGCVFYKGLYRMVNGVETPIGGKEQYMHSYVELNYVLKSYITKADAEYLKYAYYKKYAYPATQKSVEYDIRLICSTAEMERRLIALVSDCMNHGRLVTGLVGLDGVFGSEKKITYISDGCVNVTEGRLIEWSFPYSTNYVWLDEPKLLKANIPVLRETTGSVIVTPDVYREHSFDHKGNYLPKEDEDLVPILKKNL